MGKKKRITNSVLWDKQLKRIERFIREKEKEGYSFDRSIIPAKPKTVRKRNIAQISQIKAKILYEHSTWSSPNNEITVNGDTRRRAQKRFRQQQTMDAKRARNEFYSNRTDMGETGTDLAPIASTIILDNVEQMIESWAPESTWSDYIAKLKTEDKNVLRNILQGAINETDRATVAKRMEEKAERVTELAGDILYGSGGADGTNGRDEIQMKIQEFSSIITGRAPTLEESKMLTEYSENQEMY